MESLLFIHTLNAAIGVILGQVGDMGAVVRQGLRPRPGGRPHRPPLVPKLRHRLSDAETTGTLEAQRAQRCRVVKRVSRCSSICFSVPVYQPRTQGLSSCLQVGAPRPRDGKVLAQTAGQWHRAGIRRLSRLAALPPSGLVAL